jgi:hypothetical protein
MSFARGDSARRLTTDDANEVVPHWSRDGRSIYYASNASGVYEIWKKALDGGSAVQVTHNGGYSAQESFDGKMLYFTKGPSVAGIWRQPLPALDPKSWCVCCHILFGASRGVAFERADRDGACPVGGIAGLPKCGRHNTTRRCRAALLGSKSGQHLRHRQRSGRRRILHTLSIATAHRGRREIRDSRARWEPQASQEPPGLRLSFKRLHRVPQPRTPSQAVAPASFC